MANDVFTVSQALTGRTETTLTISWASESIVDYLWYSTDGGESWAGLSIADAKNGTYTISGLRHTMTYTVQTRARRKADGQTANSAVLNATTYSMPHCDFTPNFTIGDRLTLGFYNPLGRSMTVNLIGADGSTIASDVITGQGFSGYNDASAVNALINSIPNSASGVYSVEVLWGDYSDMRTGGVYSVGSDIAPTIGNLYYQDTNAATVAITGNNSHIIQNQSVVQFYAEGLSGSQAATVTACSVIVNGNTYDLTLLDGSSAAGGNVTIDSANDFNAIFTVTDSRGLTATGAITVIMLDWALPTAIIDCQRQNNYYSNTDIKVNADYASIDGNNTIEIKCRYKKTSDSTYGAYITLQDDIVTTITLDNLYEWDVQVVLTDLFGATTYNLTVPVGMPFVFFDRLLSSTGFNCFPTLLKDVAANGRSLIKSYITADLQSAVSNVQQNTYTKAPLSLYASAGDRLSVTNDGGILIGAGVSKVQVSGRIGYDGTAAGDKSARITKNTSGDSDTLAHVTIASAEADGVILITPTVETVTPGDVIYLWYKSSASGDNIPASQYGAQTCLTVETL